MSANSGSRRAAEAWTSEWLTDSTEKSREVRRAVSENRARKLMQSCGPS